MNKYHSGNPDLSTSDSKAEALNQRVRPPSVKKIKKLRRGKTQTHPLSPVAEFSGEKWKNI